MLRGCLPYSNVFRAVCLVFETATPGQTLYLLSIKGYEVNKKITLLFIYLFSFFYFLNPLLFASCTDTFSKWCKVTRGMKRSAQ
jgi:hypothetical protein